MTDAVNTTGDHASVAPRRPRPVTREGSAGRALLQYLHEQVHVLHEQDPRVRENAPDAVHTMRTATRRLRSALASYRSLLDPETADRLRDELRWLAGVLGIARDAEVLHERLRDEVTEEPAGRGARLGAGASTGATANAIDELLASGVQSAQLTVLDVLNSERYFQLLASLAELLENPPLSSEANLPSRRVARNEIDADVTRLRRAVGTAQALPAGTERDRALHDVRKRAKRLRYAAEAAVTVDPKRASRMVALARGLQEALGEHQDSVVARTVLVRLGAEAHARGEDAFGFGRLHALEEMRATAAEVRFRRHWRALLRAL
ncbi:CHAD domain-containing protein [Cryobacterium melibiosiphilum]|uniref:CHAD domain-containing protein n=1 Tax=Cryobacterium melibiosiphilum TaxID=995039 RepID=A0A3A5MKQ5_9MICO|nr:CHAD domain-containing protein [Cryobacterium melibiosiphilum]RJT84812.1 CHAD domain-containing protein [Cryobacterium melibiosiphilum]